MQLSHRIPRSTGKQATRSGDQRLNNDYDMTADLLQAPRKTSTNHGNPISILICVFLVLSSLEAYALFNIPFQWLSATFVIATTTVLMVRRRNVFPKQFTATIMFFIYASSITIYESITGSYSTLMPIGSTTSYENYISLRLITIVAFLTSMLLGRSTSIELSSRSLHLVALVGVAVSAAALYIYAAQTMGLWEPTRTRIGTSGVAQSTTFTYAFHRAMGTFREPSHLAQWLILPIFSARAIKFNKLGQIIMILTLLLTGSMTGIVSGLLGLGVSALLLARGGRLRSHLSIALALFVIITASISAFNIVAAYQDPKRPSLLTVVANRVGPVFDDGGMLNTNRAYVYEYAMETSRKGENPGLGNANILMSFDRSSHLIVSYLNLYLNVYMGLGTIGLVLLCWALIQPIVSIMKSPVFKYPLGRWHLSMLMGGVVAWLCIYFGHAEELNLSDGLLYGLAMGMCAQNKLRPRRERLK